MSRQDKATTERFTNILREIVRKPENKYCADCKKNDARWASWNIGVFLCIRCSGIHRGMGTHISKVKSVDLDTWTPEQMESIQKWGNQLANLYWEAHLKPGHVPPEHKIESFIRSKYELKKWARDDPLPSDPSVLNKYNPVQRQAKEKVSPTSSEAVQAPLSHSHGRSVTVPPQSHPLLSANFTSSVKSSPTTSAPNSTPPIAQGLSKASDNDLFSLDFRSSSSSSSPSTVPPAGAAPAKDVKQDILSLFSSKPSTTTTLGQFNSTTGSPWNTVQNHQHQGSMDGIGGIFGHGISAAPLSGQVNPWGTNAASGTLKNQPSDLVNFSFGNTKVVRKQDEVFGDIWGGFAS